MLATAGTSAAGHAYQGKAVVREGRVQVEVQRAVVRALPAAQVSARNAALPAREQLSRLVRSIQGLEAMGVPTDRERVGRINTLLTRIVQEDLAAAAAAAGAVPTGPLAGHVTEFGTLTAAGARRNAYYMDMVSWGTITGAIRARDLSRIVAEVRVRGTEWVSGEEGLEPFLESLYDIRLGSEGETDERIPGMPKYVPRPAIDAFRNAAVAFYSSRRSSRGGTGPARQAVLDTFLNDIRTGSFGVDHRGSLARHWNDTGHRTTTEARVRFASDPHNLVLVSGSWNSSKSGEGENYSAVPDVGFTRHLGEHPAPVVPPATTTPASGILASP